MYRCSFVRTPEELAAARTMDGVYTRRKTFHFSWLIKKEVYDKLLPPGLEPLDLPVVYAFVSYFPHSGFGLPAYSEGGLFLMCKHKDTVGSLCLAMPIQADNEMGIFLGRENYGYPKKCAKVQMDIIGDRVHAVIGRNGIDFFEMNGTLGEKHEFYEEPTNLGQDFITNVFLLDHKMSPVKDSIEDYNIWGPCQAKLYDQQNVEVIHSQIPMKVELTFRPSPDDPWIELAPEKILSARYTENSCDMRGCKVLETYDTPEKFAAVEPYLFYRYDTCFFGKKHEIHW